MNAKKLLTEHELAIMKVLWGAKEPLVRPQILERVAGTQINPASFHVAINALITKGYVEVPGFAPSGANYGRTYAAKKTRWDFVLNLLQATRPCEAKNRGATDLMAAFAEETPIDKTTISELEDMLAQYRKKLQQELNEKEETKE